MPSARSLSGLDWLNFFSAEVQTGFGAFIAVYLTLHHWTGLAIGSVLSLGTIVAVLSQIPAGVIVDWMPGKRLAAAVGLAAIGASATLYALAPTEFGVSVAEILHGFASCILNQAIAAISLALVGRHLLSRRLGRNVRFAGLGNGTAAALMGVAGAWLSGSSVFVLAGLLCIPAGLALGAIGPTPPQRQALEVQRPERTPWDEVRALFLDRRLLAFMACIAFFQIADAAMLPYVGRKIAGETSRLADLAIAAAIVLPQAVAALFSPLVGRMAERYGRRLVLIAGFAAEPLRGLLFAFVHPAGPLVLIQGLDGIGAAVIGVLLPLIAADIAHDRGHFNLAMGAVGVASGIGASASTTLAGAVDTFFGGRAA
ncbi:MAG TPA: MFS transporter, partial [Acetobacteraceae bacterium]|nr:MFS transporter [Acetobacteraceae bacterium]